VADAVASARRRYASREAGVAAAQAIQNDPGRQWRAELFLLPKYSPDLNPIEQVPPS
jgi:transposase